MQLNDAVQLVQAKFNSEGQGNPDGPELKAWQDAHAQFPVMMDVATQIWADQIIRMNEQAARQYAMQQQQQQMLAQQQAAVAAQQGQSGSAEAAQDFAQA